MCYFVPIISIFIRLLLVFLHVCHDPHALSQCVGNIRILDQSLIIKWSLATDRSDNLFGSFTCSILQYVKVSQSGANGPQSPLCFFIGVGWGGGVCVH